MQWPPRGEPLAASPEGRLQVDGRPSAYRFETRGKVTAPQAPATAFNLTGTGDQARARIDRLLLELLEGTIQTVGSVSWAPEPSWDLGVTLSNIDPGAQWPHGSQDSASGLVARGSC